MGKNYSQRIHDKNIALINAGLQTGKQWLLDMFVIALNDPEVMGKDVIGYNRMMRIIRAVSDNDDKLRIAMASADPEADYYRDQIDKRMKSIFKGEFSAFEERYPYLTEIKYGCKTK